VISCSPVVVVRSQRVEPQYKVRVVFAPYAGDARATCWKFNSLQVNSTAAQFPSQLASFIGPRQQWRKTTTDAITIVAATMAAEAEADDISISANVVEVKHNGSHHSPVSCHSKLTGTVNR
jgi:hypothetical protein